MKINQEKKNKIRAEDKRKYVLPEQRDLQILRMIYRLEKARLSDADKKYIRLIRTQLKADWRKPLIRFLQNLLKKYEL